VFYALSMFLISFPITFGGIALMVTESAVALEGAVPELALVNVRIGVKDLPKSMGQMVGPWTLVD
jgi:hypothetical protein